MPTSGVPAGAVQYQRFPRAPASVSQVRAWVRHGLTAALIDAECIEVVVLLASEVVTNAVLHTQSDDLLVTLTTGSFVEVTVQDQSALVAAPRLGRLLDTSGRGLHLVNALASQWGTRVAGTGKIVWFRVALTAGAT